MEFLSFHTAHFFLDIQFHLKRSFTDNKHGRVGKHSENQFYRINFYLRLFSSRMLSERSLQETSKQRIYKIIHTEDFLLKIMETEVEPCPSKFVQYHFTVIICYSLCCRSCYKKYTCVIISLECFFIILTLGGLATVLLFYFKNGGIRAWIKSRLWTKLFQFHRFRYMFKIYVDGQLKDKTPRIFPPIIPFS